MLTALINFYNGIFLSNILKVLREKCLVLWIIIKNGVKEYHSEVLHPLESTRKLKMLGLNLSFATVLSAFASYYLFFCQYLYSFAGV